MSTIPMSTERRCVGRGFCRFSDDWFLRFAMDGGVAFWFGSAVALNCVGKFEDGGDAGGDDGGDVRFDIGLKVCFSVILP